MNSFFSQKSGNTFPSVIEGPAAVALGLQYQLKYSQFWPDEKMKKMQLLQLQRLLHHAMNTVPYYQEKFKTLGINKQTAVDEQLLQSLPLLSREDIQNHKAQLLSQQVPQEHGRIYDVSTSGSTGKPIEAKGTELTTLLWKAFTLREHYWHNRDFNKKLAAIRFTKTGKASVKDNVTTPGWGPATNILHKTPPASFLNSSTNINDQAKWLQQQNPAYLISHPSNLLALAEYCIKHKISIPCLEEVRTVGEAISDHLRQTCLQAWNAKLVDMYTTQEVGYIALQCPDHDYYHVMSEGCIVEILDDNNQPCQPGEIGRIVVTPLHNFATPLIRYEIGDYGEAGDNQKCSCGRTLPVIKRILGRTRNMVKLPDGDQHWPVFGYKDFEKILNIKQIQIIQTSLATMEVNLVTRKPLTKKQKQQLSKILDENMGHGFQYQFKQHDKIERSVGGKYEEFICRC